MTDLVKRLRDLNAHMNTFILDEAADRIEELNSQIRIIQSASKHAIKAYEQHLAVYRQKLEEKPPIWHDDIQSLQ